MSLYKVIWLIEMHIITESAKDVGVLTISLDVSLCFKYWGFDTISCGAVLASAGGDGIYYCR